jgi:ATPase
MTSKSTSNHPTAERIVPDTSVLIDGLLSKEQKAGRLEKANVIVHEASIAELEHQANAGQEKGYLGLDEIGALQVLAGKGKLTLRFAGERPGEFDIASARHGAIDAMIRDLAQAEDATLYTADRVQATVARAKGLPVKLFEPFDGEGMEIEQLFTETTMSVHIKEDCPIMAKRGAPGAWDFVKVREENATREELERFAKQIVEAAQTRRDSFVEIERPGSSICQVGLYRIVITRPPFSDGYEITAVRPVKRLDLKDYTLSEKLATRLDHHAEGVLIAGAPGHGKSTFAQALAEHYAAQGKIVKTVEAPRDLVLSKSITQYAISHGSSEEIHDILLLSRPDYTFFDEMRNTDDFKLFADMRLSGVGMIGVIHGTKPIDAIQRFLGRIELGVIPHVVDTVIFIKNGMIGAVYSIRMIVKVPSGMTEADLARPVVEVNDFETGKLVFELYTYGEQTVVIPVTGENSQSGMQKLAAQSVREYFKAIAGRVDVEMAGGNKAIVSVPASLKAEIIGRGGERIQAIEKELGLSIDIRELERGKGGGTDDSNRGRVMDDDSRFPRFDKKGGGKKFKKEKFKKGKRW